MNTIDNDFKYWSLFYEEDGYKTLASMLSSRIAIIGLS